MADDIFISYRRTDEARARLLHQLLADRGIDAWYDAEVDAGADWREATAGALQAAPVFVLLFSQAASESKQIANELAAATLEDKLVIPVRLENIQPKGAFLYELARRNWFDAYDDTDARLAVLADRLAALVKGVGGGAEAAAVDLGAQVVAMPGARQKPGMRLLIGGVAALLVVAAAAAAVVLLRPAALAHSDRVVFFGFTAPGGDPASLDIASLATDETFSGIARYNVETAARSDAQAATAKTRLDRAQELGAAYALSGEVQPERGSTRIKFSARLEDVAARTTLWEQTTVGEASPPLPLAVQMAGMSAQVTSCVTNTSSEKGAPSSRDWIPALAAWCATHNLAANSETIRTAREVTKVAPKLAGAHAALSWNLAYNNPLASPAGRELTRTEAISELAIAQKLAPDHFMTATAAFMVGRLGGRARQDLEGDLRTRLERTPERGEHLYYSSANIQYGNLLTGVGRAREGASYYRTAADAGRLFSSPQFGYAYALAVSGAGEAQGQFDQSFARFVSKYGWDNGINAAVFLGVGDASALIASAPPMIPAPAVQCWRDIHAAISAGQPAARANGVVRVKTCLAAGSIAPSSAMAALNALGDIDGAFGVTMRPDTFNSRDINGALFWPTSKAMRADPRFEPLAKKLGLMDYWKATRTRPDVCETEAAPFCAALKG